MPGELGGKIFQERKLLAVVNERENRRYTLCCLSFEAKFLFSRHLP